MLLCLCCCYFIELWSVNGFIISLSYICDKSLTVEVPAGFCAGIFPIWENEQCTCFCGPFLNSAPAFVDNLMNSGHFKRQELSYSAKLH